jgi:hypothetical protein
LTATASPACAVVTAEATREQIMMKHINATNTSRPISHDLKSEIE